VVEAELAAAARGVAPGRDSLLGFADAVARLGQRAAPTPAIPELHLVTFTLDREDFGIPIDRVREIVRLGPITRVPEGPPHIRGVTNLRGRILPVVEIKTRLGLVAAVPTPRSRIVIVEAAGGRLLGILVDAVGQVLKVPVTAVTPPPPEVLSANADYFTGVARQEPRLIILLDLDKVLLLPLTRPTAGS
jgi:purine-binding chemotaxis protein CheW